MNFKIWGEPDVERLLATFKGEKTDRVPIWENLIENKHVEQILGRPAGNTLGATGEVAKGTTDDTSAARPMNPEDYMQVCSSIGQDAMIIEAMWAPVRKMGDDGESHIIADRSIKTKRDKKRIIPPSQADIDLKIGYVREYLDFVKETRIGVTLLTGSFFQLLYEFIVGFNDFMLKTYDDRDFIEELMDSAVDYYVELTSAACDLGIDFLFVADDVAFKSGLFIPPKLFGELWRPRMEKIIAPALSKGIPVMFHSDGKLDDIMNMLIDMGISCINPMDPYSIDYRDYKRRYGDKICLSGNIDIAFPLYQGTPKDVEKDVIEHLRTMMPGGKYVFGSSHSIVDYIPSENFQTMVNALHKYGRY